MGYEKDDAQETSSGLYVVRYERGLRIEEGGGKNPGSAALVIVRR